MLDLFSQLFSDVVRFVNEAGTAGVIKMIVMWAIFFVLIYRALKKNM